MLARAADTLHELGFRGLRATGLKRKHVNALVAAWQRRGLAIGTMKSRTAHLRGWAKRIDRPGVVPATASGGPGTERRGRDTGLTVARRAPTVRRSLCPVRAMSRIQLSPNEARIIGCLMEKAVLTPDQCPLTLNALTTACNQKSSREPVLALERTAVERAARGLREKSLVSRDENFRSGVVKYQQQLCNTISSELNFSEDEYAVVCLLLLRGPQTPGELRARSARLHVFSDNEAVTETLQQLMDTDREGGAVVARLARVPGRRDHQYAHLLSGAVESVPADDLPTGTQPRGGRLAELERRVTALELEVAALKGRSSDPA